ncbi:MAG: peptidoglycan editing factor PgeF [Eubacterium sp.]|nr:peptidoglycan editing factor PgeF [Eubacterium sp.]
MKTIPSFNENYPVKTFFTDYNDYKRTGGGKVASYIKRIGEELSVPVIRMIRAKESHSGNVLVIDDKSPEGRLAYTDETCSIKAPGGYDSIVTNIPGLVAAVTTADCTPVFLYDPARHVAAMVHSGWRGTVSGIAVHTIEVMEAQFQTDPRDVIAAFGPCICGHCYEVGRELISLFEKRFSTEDIRLLFLPKAEGKYYLNVKEAVRTDLIRHGLQPENIYDTGICSYESENYASYRRDGKLEKEKQTLSGIVLELRKETF